MSSTIFSGGWTNFDTNPKRHYLERAASQLLSKSEVEAVIGSTYTGPSFEKLRDAQIADALAASPVVGQAKDSTEAGHTYEQERQENNKLCRDYEDALKYAFGEEALKTSCMASILNPTVTHEIDLGQYNENQSDNYPDRTVYMHDVFPWLDQCNLDTVCSLQAEEVAPTAAVSAEKEESVNSKWFAPSSFVGIDNAAGTSTTKITLPPDPVVVDQFKVEMEKLELGNRYGRLKEVARRLVKLYITDGSDNSEFDRCVADIVEEL